MMTVSRIMNPSIRCCPSLARNYTPISRQYLYTYQPIRSFTSARITTDKFPKGDTWPQPTTLMFSIQDRIGALDQVIQIISNQANISLTRIESRPSRTKEFDYDFYVDFHANSQHQINSLIDKLSNSPSSPAKLVTFTLPATNVDNAIPWYPRKITDLDSFASKVLSYGAELDSDHPGFTDMDYRKRRELITSNAVQYRTGMALPTVEYTPIEIETWGIVYKQLTDLYPKYACREHQYIFRLLQSNCNLSSKHIPQHDQISKFLKECTGFTLRPVMGLLSSRDFLNALAFRVFYATQYIRHFSKPLYTPEPDICHELLGHVPLFADPEFADFSQEIGLASIGASDSDIEKLATVYWFTVEFGICKEDNGKSLKAYGSGLLSSSGELQYALCTDKPELRPFDPFKAAITKYPITEYQPIYYVAESFRDAKEKVREFAVSLDRPFNVRYNAYTESIEVLDTKDKLVRYAHTIKNDYQTLITALDRLSTVNK